MTALSRRAAVAGLLVASAARAAPALNGPLRFVIPFGPGGAPDVVARLIGSDIAKRYGQTIVFDNKPGAGGAVGVNYFGSLKDEGAASIVLVDEGIYAITPILRPDARVDAARDLKPISTIVKSPLYLMAGPKSGAKTLAEFIAYAKSTPNFTFGSPGVGLPHHLLMEYLGFLQSFKPTHVAYETQAPQLNDIMTGETAGGFTSAPGVRTLLANSKDVRPIAVVGAKRSPLLPDVPTFLEQGVAGFEGSALDTRFGLMTSPGAPDDLVAALNEGVALATRDPTISARFAALGFEPQTGAPDEFRALIKSDAAFYRDVVAKTGVQRP